MLEHLKKLQALWMTHHLDINYIFQQQCLSVLSSVLSSDALQFYEKSRKEKNYQAIVRVSTPI